MEGTAPRQDRLVGEAEAGWDGFAALYARTLPDVWRYLHRATGGDRAVTEDLVQEVYMAAVREHRSGHADAVCIAWLLTVARHRLVDHCRKRERDERKLALAASASTAAACGEPRISREEAARVLGSLPSMQRAALALRYLDDLSVPEVARELGKSVHATESLLARARNAFRTELAETDHDD